MKYEACPESKFRFYLYPLHRYYRSSAHMWQTLRFKEKKSVPFEVPVNQVRLGCASLKCRWWLNWFARLKKKSKNIVKTKNS